MKILLIGLGSIGKRHLDNIVSIGYTHISVVSSHAQQTKDFDFPIYNSLQKALQSDKFNAAIVANTTAEHIPTLKILLRSGIQKVYVEKPISNNWEGVEEVSKIVFENNLKIAVGYDLHFDPGLLKVKEWLDMRVIGNVVSVNAQVGQYLPDWRPQQDYRKGMSAKLATGGGVMLDLIHEFDYLHWLLGPIETVASYHNNSGALEIETEDVAEVLLKFKNGIIGTIHLDYLQQELIRNCMITGHKGSIFWNLKECRVEYINSDKQREVFEYKNFNRNDRFVSIMRAFLSNANDPRLSTFEEGLQSLKIVLAAKHSCNINAFVNLDEFTKNVLN